MPYAYLRAVFFYVCMPVVWLALWFRRIPVCHAVDIILSLKKSTFEKCSCFCYMRMVIFTDSCNTLWTQFDCRAQRNARLLVLTVTKIFACSLSHFYKLIFKMPYTNCTAVQLGLCRLGEGWSYSRVCDCLVFLNISAWNILVRV